MTLTIIAAVSDNNVIGYKGDMPWSIPEDLRRFKSFTLNHPVIMGRNTYDSIIETLGNPLPKRKSIVLTSRPIRKDFGVLTAKDFSSALKMAEEFDSLIYSVGGERVFEESLAYADRMELTRVHEKYEGDAFFPKVNWGDWERIWADPKIKYTFETWVRK